MSIRYAKTINYIWSKELAYLAGLIASDGCLLNDGRHINITSIDFEIISYVMQITGKEKNKWNIKKGAYGTEAYNFNFSDVSLFDFLTDIGITTKKSLTIDALNVPDDLFADFLRGLFDGDGTIYGFEDKRWKSSYMFYCGFASASPKFVIWLRSSIARLVMPVGGSVRNSPGFQVLAYAKEDSAMLYNYMYGPDTCHEKYSLQRKKIKFEGFIADEAAKHVII
jgi:hypothetical protein